MTDALSFTQGDAAYLAGLIDGEGCIGIYANKRGGYQLHLRIGMVDKPVLLWVQRTFGGPKILRVAHSNVRRQFWVWRVVGEDAERALRAVLPYLKGKFDQAYLALRYRREVPSQGKRSSYISRSIQERITKQVKELKSREYA